MTITKSRPPSVQPVDTHFPNRVFHRDIRRWGPYEEKLLREAYPVGGISAAKEKLPHRSEASIVDKAKKLGLSRSGTGKMKSWTGLDETRLRRLWGTAPRTHIETELPGRTWKSITSKARKLGLFRQRFARTSKQESGNQIISEIGKRMRAWGLTFTDLDDMANVRRNVTGPWFRSKTEPKLRSIQKVVEALGGTLTIVWENSD